MSAAKSTLSDDVRHRMLPPWGLYFLSICALHATKTHRVAAKARVSSRTMEDMTVNDGGYDYGQWGI